MSHHEMIAKWRWRDFLNITLGIWLIMSPATMGYVQSSPRQAWSDIIAGTLIVILGIMTLFPRFDLARWGLCAVGSWLLFAPLLFWTNSPGAFNNGMLIGGLVIAFSVLVPMMPGKLHHKTMMGPGPTTPPGWSYNPSDWMQRGPIIAMAFVGFFLSRYLAAYQLGHIAWPWDPFFGDGTQKVLDSEVSKAWPISDAGLGAVSYMLEALSGYMGGRNRWRTMPWMVAMFGVLVVPLGIVSIVLVILQPVAVGAWCSICLITAAAMLIMISPAIDEVVAMMQFLAGARREGKPLWRTFWIGGTLDSYPKEDPPGTRSQPIGADTHFKQIVAGMDLDNIPWNMLACTALGLWLMFAPWALGATGAAASSDQLIGALVVVWSVIGFGEVARFLRFLNIPLALWLIAAPFVLSGDNTISMWNDILAAVAIIIFTIPRGEIEQQYAGLNKYLV